LYLSSGEISKD